MKTYRISSLRPMTNSIKTRGLYLSLFFLFTLGLVQGQNVGIGIATPAVPLHVKSTTSEMEVLRLESANNLGSFLSIWNNSERKGFLGIVNNENDFKLGTWATGGKIQFMTEVTNPAMTILSDGRVGIGIENPFSKLHILSGSNPISMESNTADSYMTIFNSFGYVGYMGAYTEDDDIDFGTGGGNLSGKTHLVTNASPRLTVDSSGNVGIGTENPTELLDLTGNFKLTGQIKPNGIAGQKDQVLVSDANGLASWAASPPPPPPIDTTRNLASDFELAKHLCDCPNLPPFMIKKLLESGYTQGELVGSGVPLQDVIDGQRGGIMIDPRDNKPYKTVTIGNQTWMAENLNVGTVINETTDQTDNNIIEKYCHSDDIANCTTYGGLYQWDEMMQYVTTEGTQGVCPTGWHLPTDAEWKELEMEMGMTLSHANSSGDYRGTDQGSQLAGNEPLWNNGAADQNGAFGSSGFAALPGGNVLFGVYVQLSYGAYFFTSSEYGNKVWTRFIRWNSPKVSRSTEVKISARSVRCVQDQ